MGKSSDGSGVSDPPFAQLGGDTLGGGGWRDRVSAFGQGAFNAIAPTEFKEAVAGVGDARAFQKRRGAERFKQKKGPEIGGRQIIRTEAEEFLGNNKSGGF